MTLAATSGGYALSCRAPGGHGTPGVFVVLLLLLWEELLCGQLSSEKSGAGRGGLWTGVVGELGVGRYRGSGSFRCRSVASAHPGWCPASGCAPAT